MNAYAARLDDCTRTALIEGDKVELLETIRVLEAERDAACRERDRARAAMSGAITMLLNTREDERERCIERLRQARLSARARLAATRALREANGSRRASPS